MIFGLIFIKFGEALRAGCQPRGTRPHPSTGVAPESPCIICAVCDPTTLQVESDGSWHRELARLV